MIRKFLGKSLNFKLGARFANIPKPPQNPTMAESFGTKIDKKDLEKLLNPTGFLDEKDYKEYEGIDKDGKVVKTKADDGKKELGSKEYGFKVKGPEPTRFGDWERKGRVSDF